MNHHILQEIIILLIVAVVAVGLFRRLRLPPILAYLTVGVLVGPQGLGWIEDTEDTRFIAEFGVVFLLFMIGLEFSLPRLVAMRGAVLGVGGAQVAISTLVFGGSAWLLGVSPEGALVIGGILALSSTAVVTKQLTDQLELSSRHGRTALGILLFQDLAVVPFLVLIPILGAGSEELTGPLLWAMGKAIVVFALMLGTGHWLLRPLFHEVASARSTELFTLTVLLVAMTAAWATHTAGLSLALGAFLAGMMLSETEYRHQVEADIRPFRDILLGLFFVTVGMLVDLRALPDIWHWVLLVTLGTMAFKAVLVLALTRFGGAPAGVGLRAGLVVAQGGEFGFALLALATQERLFGEATGQIVLTSVLLSMAVAPMLIRFNGAIAKSAFADSYSGNRERMEKAIKASTRGLHDHVLICGYGRIGQNVARFLEREGIEFVAMDLDPERVHEARAAGEQVHYGDSARREILLAAGLERARMVVVSFDALGAAHRVLRHVREVREDVPVLVRTSDDGHLEELLSAGATEVVPDTLEASLMLASHLLMLLGVPAYRVSQLEQEVRGDRYRLLRGFYHGEETDSADDKGAFRERLHTVTVPPGARSVGRTLGELDLADIDVRVTAVRRAGIRGPDPSDYTQVRAGDVLVLYGTPESLEKAESRLLGG